MKLMRIENQIIKCNIQFISLMKEDLSEFTKEKKSLNHSLLSNRINYS
jgi:hypothetical protein